MDLNPLWRLLESELTADGHVDPFQGDRTIRIHIDDVNFANPEHVGPVYSEFTVGLEQGYWHVTCDVNDVRDHIGARGVGFTLDEAIDHLKANLNRM